MQVQDDARAGRARGGERPPAERRLQVVGVHDARAGGAHRGGDLLLAQTAAQQASRRPRGAQRGGVPREQLRVLAQPLAHERQQVLDDPLLPARRAVAVVQEEDHRAPQT